MRVLIIAPHYEPDLGPAAPMFTMLCQGLVRRRHEVTVLAAVPHYPSGRVPDNYRGRWIQRSTENGVTVMRVALPSVNRANFARRLLQFISYQFGATCAGMALQYDVVISANPALWVWLPFTWLGVLRHKPTVFSVYDVYPDVGITLGIFRHKPVIATVASLECFCLRYAAVVHILSESFRPALRSLGVPDSKIALVYPWVDTDLIQPSPNDNAFAEEHKLKDRFVVLYAGNLGLSQGLQHVLTAAEQLTDQRDLIFVFLGDGAGREHLVTQAKQRRLSNVQFLPYQPRERLPEVLASADISLVSLRRGIGTDSLPSKTFSILASGRAVLASVDEGSETWNLVKRAEAGICVPPENPSGLVDAIMVLKQNKKLLERLGQNGRIWAEHYHSPQSAAKQFENLLLSAIASNHRL